MAAKPLRFKRATAGLYHATGGTHEYVVFAVPGGWILRIRTLITTAGVRHAVGQPVVAEGQHDTKSLAVAVANEYHQLGDSYQPHEHGYQERSTRAVILAYEKEN